jgi:hypothetical protein
MNCPNETTNETDINTQGQGPKISILTIAKIAAAVIAFLLIIAILGPSLIHLREYRHRIRCAENLTGLGKAMLIYAGVGDDKYPIADKWCDLLIEHAEVTPKSFRCRGAPEGRCNYAMNKNIEKLGIYARPDMVLLFESKPGWNQSGGPELLSMENHKGKGCNVLFNDLGPARFVTPKQVGELKWKAE